MANRVKEIRTRRGLTVSALADLVGMSHTHISRIENGLRGLSIPVAERLAKAMNTTVSDVLGVNGVSGSSPSGHSGIREDAEPYEPTSSDPIPLRPVRGQNIDPWRIKTNALDRAGIKRELYR